MIFQIVTAVVRRPSSGVFAAPNPIHLARYHQAVRDSCLDLIGQNELWARALELIEANGLFVREGNEIRLAAQEGIVCRLWLDGQEIPIDDRLTQAEEAALKALGAAR